MAWTRIGRALGNLGLAMINATLILLALCLWLAWQLGSEVSAITDGIAGDLLAVQPLRDDVTGLTEQIAALRSDLEIAGDQAGADAVEALDRLRERSARLEDRLADLSGLVARISEDPGLLLDRGIALAVGHLGDQSRALLNCRAPLPSSEPGSG